MRVTVCQLDATAIADEWPQLVAHVRAEGSELVLLPELGLSPWIGLARTRDEAVWAAAVRSHEEWIATRLGELGATVVLGSRPTARRRNAAYVWTADGHTADVHEKAYVPDEEDFWEASWYDRGDGSFAPAAAGAARVGFLICTEMWFLEHARAYGRAGAHVIAVPRCTPHETFDKWLAGGRTCAVVAGAWCISSNHAGDRFGGRSWIIAPDGDVVGVTADAEPFLTSDLPLDAADAAKTTYPRYVPELSEVPRS